jgi:hypothetical protein
LAIVRIERNGSFLHDGCVGKDVVEGDAALCQDLADQEPSMTIVRLGLATQQREPMRLSSCFEATDRLLEARLCGHRFVECVTFGVVMLLAGRTTAELGSEKEVPDTFTAQTMLELALVELRGEAREGE